MCYCLYVYRPMGLRDGDRSRTISSHWCDNYPPTSAPSWRQHHTYEQTDSDKFHATKFGCSIYPIKTIKSAAGAKEKLVRLEYEFNLSTTPVTWTVTDTESQTATVPSEPKEGGQDSNTERKVMWPFNMNNINIQWNCKMYHALWHIFRPYCFTYWLQCSPLLQ